MRRGFSLSRAGLNEMRVPRDPVQFHGGGAIPCSPTVGIYDFHS